MQKVSVKCEDIRLAYGDTPVLKNVNIEVRPGEFFALLGPSGSGKSTLLRLIAGFNQHQHGRLLIDDKDVTGLPPWKRNIGMVFQSYALWPHMTVWDNVAFGLVERRPNQLSGGQQQRVALARTVVIEPQVLLLDEPLSNLDKSLRVQMRQELWSLQRRLGITTIFVTHDQEEAMTTADRMAILDKGVVQQLGTPATLYDYPANAFVASFVGTMNLLPARVSRRQSRSLTLQLEGIGELEWAADADTPAVEQLMLSFRPHSLCVDAADAARDARYLWLPGVVEASEFLGEAMRYRVRVGGHSVCVDQPHRAGLSTHEAGSSIGLGLDRTQVRLLAH